MRQQGKSYSFLNDADEDIENEVLLYRVSVLVATLKVNGYGADQVGNNDTKYNILAYDKNGISDEVGVIDFYDVYTRDRNKGLDELLEKIDFVF